MKNIIYGIIISCLIFSCEEERLKPYTGKDTIQFYTTKFDKDIVKEFFWAAALNPESNYDTCWIPVQTMGHAISEIRHLKIIQETAIGWNYVYDHVGNVVDSASYVIPNQAVVGKHFMPFDTPSLQHLMVMPANSYQTDIPVVMVKDPTLKKKLTLQIRLVDTEDVTAGDPQFTKCLITIE